MLGPVVGGTLEAAGPQAPPRPPRCRLLALVGMTEIGDGQPLTDHQRREVGAADGAKGEWPPVFVALFGPAGDDPARERLFQRRPRRLAAAPGTALPLAGLAQLRCIDAGEADVRAGDVQRVPIHRLGAAFEMLGAREHFHRHGEHGDDHGGTQNIEQTHGLDGSDLGRGTGAARPAGRMGRGR